MSDYCSQVTEILNIGVTELIWCLISVYCVLNVSLTFYDPLTSITYPCISAAQMGLDSLYGARKAEEILIKQLRFNTIQKNSSNIKHSACVLWTQDSLEKDI